MNDQKKMTDEYVWFEAWKAVRLVEGQVGHKTWDYADIILKEFRKRFPHDSNPTPADKTDVPS